MNKRGKSLIIIGLFLILLVSTLIAFVLSSESINTKIYDPETKTITIKNFLGSEKIADIQLKSNIKEIVPVGYHKVAEIEIKSYQDYSTAFKGIELYDKKENMAKISRQYDLKYKTYEDVEIDDYSVTCSDIWNEKNKTYYKTCIKHKSGSHMEKQEVWKELTSYDFKKGEVIDIGIFTNVQKGDYVEWVSEFFGVRLNEWAEWYESLSYGLVAYWKFNETTGTNAIDSVTGLYNATYDDYISLNQTGTIDKAILLQNQYSSVILNDSMYNGTMTLSFWLKDGGGGYAQHKYIWEYEGEDYIQLCFYVESGKFQFYGYNPAYVPFYQFGLDTSYPNLNEWTHYVLTITNDGTGEARLYVNGALIANDTSVDIPEFKAIYSSFGEAGPYGAVYNITIDEAGWWNRVLNSSEISDLYNNGSGITYEVVDTIPPETSTLEIIPTEPKTAYNLQCYATLTDNIQQNLTAYWKWYKNNISYLSGNTSVTNGNYSLISTLASGNTSKGEQWICEVLPFDGYNNGTAKNSSSVTILNTAPNHSMPLLSTLSGKNFSYENLTCYNQSTFDADGDNVTNIYNWYKNNQPFSVLNMPFEINVDDYSGKKNNGTIYGASFVAGKVGNALSFDGVDDYVDIGKMKDLESKLNSSFSVSVWIKTLSNVTNRRLMGSVDNGSTQAFTISWNYGSTAQVNNLRIYLRDDESNDSYSYLSSLNPKLTEGVWHHYVFGRNDNTELFVYIDGEKQTLTSYGTLPAVNAFIGTGFQYPFVLGAQNDRGVIANFFNGTIDEVKIYPYALTPEQIQANYNLEYNKIVSQKTTAGDNWMCQVTPNDAEDDGLTLNSTTAEIKWAITFNVTSGEDGSQITQLDNIVCNNSWSSGSVSAPFEFGFLPGSYECTFSKEFFYDKTITFTADSDKIVNVKLSREFSLTIEEHTWLEWLYNCWHNGDCWNLLENINQTTTQIWQRMTGTDRSVITQEKVLSYELSASSNISINYTIKVPYKEGVAINELLPIRLYFWFTDVERITCYSQDKGTDTNRAEAPYCLPLVAETLGPNNGTLTFTVDLRPSLTTGTYNFTRSVEIDPLGIWTQYGRENIGQIEVLDSGDASIGVANENRINFEASTDTLDKQAISQGSETETTQSSKPGITGAVIGSVSGWQMVAITGIIAGLFLALIICQTIIKLKSLKTKHKK